MTTLNEFAKIALSQLTLNNNPLGILSLFVNAHNFKSSEAPEVVSFSFDGSEKCNHIEIRLICDLYNVVFSNITEDETTIVSTHKGLYFDQLKPTFEEDTGLYLSLS